MLSEWLADDACNRNPYVRLVAGLIFSQEGNEVEALKALNNGGALTLEMCAGGRGGKRGAGHGAWPGSGGAWRQGACEHAGAILTQRLAPPPGWRCPPRCTCR
jgi:hypothetical protein